MWLIFVQLHLFTSLIHVLDVSYDFKLNIMFDTDTASKVNFYVSCVTKYIIILFACLFVCLMVFNATFNNISVVSCRSVLLVEETGAPGENHQPVASH
jgi:hypothetical protein